MKYDLILFDADGTLYDFDTAEWEAFKATMNHFGIHDNISQLHTIYEIENKRIWQEFEKKKISPTELRLNRFTRFFKIANLDLAPETVSPFYLHQLSLGTHLLDGALEIVQHFHGKYHLAIATNGLAVVQNPRFATSILHGFFNDIFISDEIGHAKPEREFFQFIFEKIPNVKNSIIIGDNLFSDIKGGNDFGIDTCWFNPKSRKNETGIVSNYEISMLSELKSIIEI